MKSSQMVMKYMFQLNHCLDCTERRSRWIRASKHTIMEYREILGVEGLIRPPHH